MRKILWALAVLASPVASQAQSDARPEILVLGTYHMSNPGRDVFNMKADDVLAPKRQREIAELIEALKQFHPTKVAIEAEVGSERVSQQYSDYRAGKYALTANEIDQIGYRVAKELGHSTVYPIDIEGDFPLPHVTNYAKANGKTKTLEAIEAGWGAQVKQQDDFLHSHTVLETLEYMNADPKAAENMGSYYSLVPLGDPDDSAGADLLAAWFQRNIRIYQNIVKLVESPREKILVIHGAGHLAWLRQDVSNDPSVKLRKLAEFTARP